ncbi:MAG TPA: hypothetical protein IAA28_06070, partial [Candidatus Lachnoclostridium stercoripullorum]|nr:hypothetical protein [Candidatus Lachnoclostridium stercoripullorum]
WGGRPFIWIWPPGFCGTAADKAIDFYQFLISICFQFFDRPFGRQISKQYKIVELGDGRATGLAVLHPNSGKERICFAE